MPIVGFPGRPPVIDANTGEHVRFTMSDGRRIIICQISVSALRSCFGEDKSDPIELFNNFQEEIEMAASEKYDISGVDNSFLKLDDEDFD